jgi:hypothetical protein
LVVDDELAGLTSAHLKASQPEIEAILRDPDSPEVAAILKICRTKIDVSGFESDPKAFASFLDSDRFVTEVLSTEWFRAGIDTNLQEKLANFFTLLERVKSLRMEFEKAFPSPEYSLIFSANRPPVTDARGFDFLFLDLVLLGSAAPVDDLKTYLTELANDAADDELPPIVAMSTAEDELKDHRREFSKTAQISAAGLWVLPKSDLQSEDFKARGLRVLFDQLMRQRPAAHRMRFFLRRWTAALDRAADAAATTLWNLDAAAVQRIHHTAIRDNDPFDGHLGDLISREYLWNVEADASVASRWSSWTSACAATSMTAIRLPIGSCPQSSTRK